MGRRDGPEHMRQRNRLRSALSLMVIIAVLWPYSFLVGATGATFTLVNRTGHFLHAVVNNETSAYLAPGSITTYDVGLASVVAEIRYSPGQDVKGSAIRSFPIVVHSSSSSKASNDCSNTSSTCSSSTESSGTRSADPITWTVTEDDLQLN